MDYSEKFKKYQNRMGATLSSPISSKELLFSGGVFHHLLKVMLMYQLQH
jgi:hypothetical protein